MLPHSVFFVIFNLIYVIPVIYVFIFGYDQGGVTDHISIDDELIVQMLWFYLAMFVSFFSGSALFGYGLKVKNGLFNVVKADSDVVFKFVIYSVCLCLLFTKVILYREGVYGSYAFDSGAMSSKAWTISMGLSELLVVLYVYSLLAGHAKHAFLIFIFISLNLLHGTRIFFLITVLIYLFHSIYYIKRFTKKQIILLSTVLFFFLLGLFFLIFVYRSGVSLDIDNINYELLFSPIVYESLFNQISFLKMLEFLNSGAVGFSPLMFLHDVVFFTLPNFFSGSKYSILYVSKFGELSPLGGLSGYASAIIYFSWYAPVWYFLLGSICSILLRFSRGIRFVIISKMLYVYFVCDTLFRFHRDPYYIAAKMLVNNFMFVAVVFLFSWFLHHYFSKGLSYVRKS